MNSTTMLDSALSSFDDFVDPVAMDSVDMWKPPTVHDDEHYNMSHKHRGKLLVFNHETYDDNLNLEKRSGTGTDVTLLRNRFNKLHFQVECYEDLKVAEIHNILFIESRKIPEYQTESDCLVIAVLTHGEDNGVLFARDQSYQVETLWEQFTATMCPELAGKPKIFLIQACRGRNKSESVNFTTANVTQLDSKPIVRDMTTYSIPSEADLLIAYSTFTGTVAYRDTVDGTWFIQELVNELEETGKSDDLLSILTRVNRRVAIYHAHENYKQMPTIQSTLTRKIYFGSVTRGSHQEVVTDSDKSPGLEKSAVDTILAALSELQLQHTRQVKVAPKRHKLHATQFEELQPIAALSYHALPSNDSQILLMAKALKMYLNDRTAHLTPSVAADGQTILYLMALWKTMNDDTRCYAYSRMVDFLQVHAKDWKCLELLEMPHTPVRRRLSLRGTSESGVDQGLRSPYSSLKRAPKKK